VERGLAIALAVICTGLACSGWAIWQWTRVDFGPLTDPAVLRVLTCSMVLIAMGVQIAFMAFLLCIVAVRNRPEITEVLGGGTHLAYSAMPVGQPPCNTRRIELNKTASSTFRQEQG